MLAVKTVKPLCRPDVYVSKSNQIQKHKQADCSPIIKRIYRIMATELYKIQKHDLGSSNCEISTKQKKQRFGLREFPKPSLTSSKLSERAQVPKACYKKPYFVWRHPAESHYL